MNTPKPDEIQKKGRPQINIDFSQKYELPKASGEKTKVLSFFLKGCKKGDKYMITDSKGAILKIEMIECICSMSMLPIVKIEGEEDPCMLDVSGSNLMISNTREDRFLNIVSIEKL